MNIAEASIRYKVVTLVLTVMLVGGGIVSYNGLSRLEDPEFTIKSAQVVTFYPGATAAEVAEEVTDEIETAIQAMGELDLITSISREGQSIILVDILPQYKKKELKQVWDELRRKVGDVQSKLPPNTSTSIVNDSFGDVYGVFYAVYGDGYSYKELKDYADLLRRELLLVEDVGKISFYGEQTEVVYVEISRARMASLGISPKAIYDTLSGQNLVVPAGNIRVGSQYIRFQPSGDFTSIEDIGELLIIQDDASAARLYMKDVAKITRGYADPPTTLMRFKGRPAIGVGISTFPGGNVVTMGDALTKRIEELKIETPIGIEIGVVAHQADTVITSISNFIVSLVEAVAIVIGVLMFAMGLRSGLLIGFILVLTVLATFIPMAMAGIALERISLGALIIALGMLVDNAIVVVEGILINQQRGMKPVEAASKIAGQTMWPLLFATIVAILTFAAIGASNDSTGEFCRSLFYVMLISLMLSWILAITITPLFGVMFLKIKPSVKSTDPGESNSTENNSDEDLYGGIIFRIYHAFLVTCLRMRWLTLAVLAVMLYCSTIGFGFVSKSFFPPSTRPQFQVHYWLPQGVDIKRTESDVEALEQQVQNIEGVSDVASFIGRGATRFLLTYTAEDPNSAYALLLVGVDSYDKIDTIMGKISDIVNTDFPDAQSFSRRFVLGPGDPAKIHARVRGPNYDAVRQLATRVRTTMEDDPLLKGRLTDVTEDWRQRVPLVRPVIAETQARNAGLTRANIANALLRATEGVQVGIYREDDILLPIIVRSPATERKNIEDLFDTQIYSPVAKGTIPIRQVVIDYETVSENAIIRRYNRLPCLTVKCDPTVGEATTIFPAVRAQVEAAFNQYVEEHNFVGYTLEWGGEYEDSNKAQGPLMAKLPPIVLIMFFIVICLFNSIRQPLMIFMIVPLALIGVTVGLLLMDQPFGFMALLGFMSLAGMLIKNAIVLIDEINLQIKEGKAPYDAILGGGMSRMRPVSLAAMTTVLGMIPLLTDAFFASMAVTIMFGLTFATVLTLVVIPVLYAVFYRVRCE